MCPSRANSDRLLTFLALCGVAAPLIFAAIVAVATFRYEGYSHLSQAISELGAVDASDPIIQNANFLVVGVLVMAFALGLHLGMAGRSWLGPALVGIFGLSAGIGNALLPCDPGCEFESVKGSLHNITGLAGMVAAVAGVSVISGRLNDDPGWRPLRRYSLVTGVAALIALAVWIGSMAADAEGVDGALQRVFVGIWLLWIEVMALRLFWLSLRPQYEVRPAEA